MATLEVVSFRDLVDDKSDALYVQSFNVNVLTI